MSCAVRPPELKANAKTVTTNEEIAPFGPLSANGAAEIGAIIAEAMRRVGDEGVMMIEVSQFDRSDVNPYVVTNADKMRAEHEDPCILVHEATPSGLQALVPVLETVVRSGRPPLILAEDIAIRQESVDVSVTGRAGKVSERTATSSRPFAFVRSGPVDPAPEAVVAADPGTVPVRRLHRFSARVSDNAAVPSFRSPTAALTPSTWRWISAACRR